MEIIIEKDPNLGKDLRKIFNGVFDTSVRLKNILFGVFVGSILLGGVIVFVASLAYFLGLLLPS